jgi:hypothetical protein
LCESACYAYTRETQHRSAIQFPKPRLAIQSTHSSVKVFLCKLTNMYAFLCLLILALLTPLVEAFSHDCPPRPSLVVPKLALPNRGKGALMGALALMLTLPVAEPSWAATSSSFNDIVSAAMKVDEKIDDLTSNLNTKMGNMKDSLHNEVQAVKNEVFWAPGLTASIGIAFARVSSYNADEARKDAEKKADQARQDAEQAYKKELSSLKQKLLVICVLAGLAVLLTSS